MGATQLTGLQVKDGTIQRLDLDVVTPGKAVVAKIIQGAGISISSSGVDAGTGDVTIAATGTAPVTSVFSRTGAVIAQAGDYTPAQVGAEPALGAPSSTSLLQSTSAGIRSWVPPTAGLVGAEPALGNPSGNGMILSSTTGGARSWIAQTDAVPSVFGRTGAIVAAAGDYAAFYEVPLTFYDSLSRGGTQIHLVGDATSPGNLKYYGTSNVGAKGFYDLPQAGSGTVTNFASGNLGILFTTSVATPTTTPNQQFTISNQPANSVFANNTGAVAAPTWSAMAALTETDDTNVTCTLGGTPATALLKAVSITLGWTGVLSIARGGTGAATVPANTVFNNLSASTAAPSWSAMAALTSVNDTNVTLTLGGTPATSLMKAVSITAGWTGQLAPARGGVPSGGNAGDILRKNSATSYDYIWDSPASKFVSSPSNPPGITGTTVKMAGLGTATYGPFNFTPQFTGTCLIMMTFGIQNNTAGGVSVAGMRYGTGTAPNNGAAQVGTTGPAYVQAGATVNGTDSTTLVWVVALTVGTTYWFDLAIQGNSSTQTVSVSGCYLAAVELA